MTARAAGLPSAGLGAQPFLCRAPGRWQDNDLSTISVAPTWSVRSRQEQSFGTCSLRLVWGGSFLPSLAGSRISLCFSLSSDQVQGSVNPDPWQVLDRAWSDLGYCNLSLAVAEGATT